MSGGLAGKSEDLLEKGLAPREAVHGLLPFGGHGVHEREKGDGDLPRELPSPAGVQAVHAAEVFFDKGNLRNADLPAGKKHCRAGPPLLDTAHPAGRALAARVGLAGGAEPFADDDGACRQVAQPLAPSRRKDTDGADDAQRRWKAVHDPQEVAQERLAHAQGQPAGAHHPDPQRALARRLPPHPDFEEEEVPPPHREPCEQQDDSGPRRQRLPGAETAAGRQGEDHQCRVQGKLDGGVYGEGKETRAKAGQPELKLHVLGRCNPRRFAHVTGAWSCGWPGTSARAPG